MMEVVTGQVWYAKRVQVYSSKVSLQLTQGRQEATNSMPPLKLCQNLLIRLSCYRCHKPQLGRSCIPNLPCDYFN